MSHLESPHQATIIDTCLLTMSSDVDIWGIAAHKGTASSKVSQFLEMQNKLSSFVCSEDQSEAMVRVSVRPK